MPAITHNLPPKIGGKEDMQTLNEMLKTLRELVDKANRDDLAIKALNKTNSTIVPVVQSMKKLTGGGICRVNQQANGTSFYVPSPLPFSGISIFYGKAVAAFDNGSSLTLDPCDADGEDNGESNLTANFRAAIDIRNATIDEASVAVTCEIPVTEVLPYVDVGGTYYILCKPPIQVLTEYQVDTTALTLETKVRFDFGLFASSESDWLTVHTGDQCEDATNAEILSLMEL